jgi:flavin-dependent dehydrogenase
MGSAWDVIVAGAGPAGSRAAERLARGGTSVLLLDPRAPWEKPCGGGLTAAALRHTPELDELVGESHVIREVQVAAPSGVSAVLPLRRPYRVVSRLALCRWGLGRATAAGACFQSRGVQSAVRADGAWTITDSTGGVHRARRLVAADGAASRLRAILAPRLKPELAPTRVAYPAAGAPPGRAVFRFLPSIKGYLWDFPRPDHHSIGVCVPPGTWQRGALDEAIARYRRAAAGAGEPAENRGAVIGTWNWEQGSFADLGGHDFAIVGDAAGLADPATGEGIDYALRSGSLAAEAYDPELGFERYPACAWKAFRAEIRRALTVWRWLYRETVAERLVSGLRRSPRTALALMALVDAMNEHSALLGALRRAAFPSRADLAVAEAVCRQPDGSPGNQDDGQIGIGER